MLARIMRHPAGLMRLALRRTFARLDMPGDPAPAPRAPDYWGDRFSGLGLLLVSNPAASKASAKAAPEPRAGSRPTRPSVHLLPRQGGKASSFLAVQ